MTYVFSGDYIIPSNNLSFRATICHSEQSEESGAGNRYRGPVWCFRSFADAQDDKSPASDPYAAGASLYNKRGAGCMPAPAEVLYLF